MKLIEQLVDNIDEELEGAESYAKYALKYKEIHPMLAKTLYAISADEMHHVSMLHDEVMRLIEQHQNTHGDPPAAMLAVWEYVHEKHIQRANKIKIMQNEYKSM